MKEYIVSSKEANQKIEKFVKKTLNATPLPLIYKLFRKKDIKVNGKWVDKDYVVKENDKIAIYLPNTATDLSKEKTFPKLKITFDVVYEDDNLLIVNKPAGLLVHDDINNTINTLANQVLSYLFEKGEFKPGSAFTPGPCHRLDRNTSGIVIFGKTNDALRIMNDCFKDRVGIAKYYYALVKGNVNKSLSIEKRLLKDEKTGLVKVNEKGLEALSLVKPIYNTQYYSLVEVELKTGRTHQIRVHMASVSHPVLGDKKYGDFDLNDKFYKEYKFENQFLHAYKVCFYNLKEPLSYLNNQNFISELPNDKKKIVDKIFNKKD